MLGFCPQCPEDRKQAYCTMLVGSVPRVVCGLVRVQFASTETRDHSKTRDCCSCHEGTTLACTVQESMVARIAVSTGQQGMMTRWAAASDETEREMRRRAMGGGNGGCAAGSESAGMRGWGGGRGLAGGIMCAATAYCTIRMVDSGVGN